MPWIQLCCPGLRAEAGLPARARLMARRLSLSIKMPMTPSRTT